MRLNDYTVPNKEFKISVDMEFKSDSLGAQTSSTEAAHQGIKPKSVSINLLITHDDDNLLSELTAIAESTQGDGSLTTYNVTDKTCNAMNIRQVTFAKNLTVSDDANLKAWRVTFSLVEYKSVPEKVEQRAPTNTTQIQSAEGTPVAEVEEAAKPLTGFEKTLSAFDSLLKPTA